MRSMLLMMLSTLYSCSAAYSRPPLAFATPTRRHGSASAIRMSGDDDSKPPLALPSLQTLLFGLIAAQSSYTLASDVPRLIAGASPLPITSVVLNTGFLGWGLLNIAKTLGFGKTDYYGELDDSSVKSLARDAGEWALSGTVPTKSKDGRYEVATFAGGCFWGTELHFQRLPGVIETCVGYTQGELLKPSYAQVCSGMTGHAEGLQITFDPSEISYDALCDKLLSTVDSSALNRVGNDRGTQYRHGLYFHTPEQQAAATRAIEREQKMQGNRQVVTEVKAARVFWPAENCHQRCLQKGGQSAAKGEKVAVRCYG